ncbi:CvfB family protein [Fructilactobacillus fructivorans]|uniref:S1 RNA binding domain n=1 Tax=Fructilactobacillus fructivorans TaxID=1614 RepID=A0A0C1PP90_9LACO|nr:S1-like domain-containing RNA-binding protein [Fructilactobacillus fructivorans]KID42607.1 S1 RNA binding domain [Fructilactobacillus fructivorans]MCT0151833.1 DNA-binding protein [Fructilactobacillus fructivorans]MCT2868038.1 DNA-binding protein [Fructilactobacillus fructivorans]MCT2868690.1 DNA-binding protein [Fructilactobacillus fructivorans]MCT2873379.1 DNA-binding protein [Fructilactobacillus fructivorans]
MNEDLGTVITGKVIDENDKEYFIQNNGITYSLNKDELKKPIKMGGNFKGFVYENEKHQMKITRNVPDVGVDSYAWGKVVGIKFGLGIFVNIGLPDKDVAVSLDDLPDIKSLWPEVGDELLISLKKDSKNRIWGELADSQIYKAISQPVNDPKLKNRDVTAWVINPKLMGTEVITDHYNLGFIDKSEEEQQPRLGEKVNARIIGIRPNKTLYLSLRPRAYEVIGEDAKMIQTILEHKPNNELPYNDKSDPQEIKDYFGISKAQFKRALGRLLKARIIEETPTGIKLAETR